MEKKLKQEPSNCLKVVLFGPESTGKTTLANQLAKHYNTVFVKEFSRVYAKKKSLQNKKLTENDVLTIAIGQIALENQQQKLANKLLICDTDLLETKVYSKFYYNGYCPELVRKYAKLNTYNLYFLTYIDTPWEADGLRDKPHEREAMFNAFEKALINNNRPYVLLKGDNKKRLATAIKHIDKLILKQSEFH